MFLIVKDQKLGVFTVLVTTSQSYLSYRKSNIQRICPRVGPIRSGISFRMSPPVRLKYGEYTFVSADRHPPNFTEIRNSPLNDGLKIGRSQLNHSSVFSLSQNKMPGDSGSSV